MYKLVRGGLSVPRRRVAIGLAVFVATVMLAVAVNGVGHGFDLGRSVSRYVGFEAWSAVLFTICNLFVVVMVAGFLWRLGAEWKMPRVFYYLVFVMSVTLILLSVFPIGFCDFDGKVSLVSRIHEVSSRTMFVTMMLVAAMIAGNSRASRVTKVAAVGYVVYGLICTIGYLTKAGWFLPWVLFLESAYVVGFLVMLLFCRGQRGI